MPAVSGKRSTSRRDRKLYLQRFQFVPDIDARKVTAQTTLNQPAPAAAEVALHFRNGGVSDALKAIPAGADQISFDIAIPDMRLWSLEDPFLYEVDLRVRAGAGTDEDSVASYFGMRKISVMPLPGTDFPYIALNHKPVYLQLTLDQSYHPDGFYTFPTDAFMRDEILRSRRIGLNANRLHVKVDVPRKLYWADRLGLLIMADVPNSWGEPGPEMRQEVEQTLRAMIERDYNHPAIFAWVPFNETWGLFTTDPSEKKEKPASDEKPKRHYLPETQTWVASVYKLAKQLDPTRLVEDNSPCNFDHTESDLNSWHAYLPGYAWREHLDQVTHDSRPGSKWNFIGGRTQGSQPLLNSECGNVWGYEGSTGDCDWSWDYHIMMNEFRRHPQVCGWLYTEHHDVINEWNGYYRFDRTEKLTGLEEIVPGMTLRDLHSPFYIAPAGELCRDAKPGETIEVPLWASFMTDQTPSPKLKVRGTLTSIDNLGRSQTQAAAVQSLDFQPWLAREIKPMKVRLPDAPSVAVLALTLEDAAGVVLHRNFSTFAVGTGEPAPRTERRAKQRLVRFAPNSFSGAQWSQKQWEVLDGLKVNGAGSGYFEYRVPWPADLKGSEVEGGWLVFEASAKQLFGKDRKDSRQQEGDFMLGKGTHDPSLNPNAYPMTDTVRYPSAVRVRLAGESAGLFDLPDDPADHRGILSWHAQKRDKKLREAGSYGYLVQAALPPASLQRAAEAKELVIRLEVDESFPGGLALYGERFGRYPLDPTVVLTLRK
ncbi:MAG: glycoside hydrolase family 2 TIM barrel-domain containing protein [Verrucomicrobiota bacterium]